MTPGIVRGRPKWIAVLPITLAILACEGNAQAAGWLRCAPSAAHGLGAVDSMLYTNSREAFLANYARGFRVFEIDLRYTRDSVLVLAHDWNTRERQEFKGDIPSLAAFRATKSYGKYTPLTFTDALQLLNQYADAKAILDLKPGPRATASDALREITRVNRALISRVAPQVWSDADAKALRSLAEWPLVYSLHFAEASDNSVMMTVGRYRVGAVVLDRFRWSTSLAARLRRAGVGLYLSVVNTNPEARLYRSWGVQGFYTDLLAPDSLCW